MPNLETKPFFQSKFVTDFKKSRHHKNYDNGNGNNTVYVKTYLKGIEIFANSVKYVSYQDYLLDSFEMCYLIKRYI